MLIALIGQNVLRTAQITEEGVEVTALHAGHAVRADLFLVDEQAQIGVYRGLAS